MYSSLYITILRKIDISLNVYIVVPRKNKIKLDKIVSTKISLEDYQLLEKNLDTFYTLKHIELPTMSHLVRWIIGAWARQMREIKGSSASEVK